MTHILSAVRTSSGEHPGEMAQPRALVHVVDVDDEVTRLVSGWLDAAGIESRTYARFDPFMSARSIERPGCLVIDAQQVAMGVPVTRYPIVIIAHRADVSMAVRAMKTGAVDFFEKPMREREFVAAIFAAIALDRRQTLIASRLASVHTSFATLTRREREVMALVTAGNLNKQVGGHLGLSEITVKSHRGSVMRKMGARSLADLVRMAVDLGDELTAPAIRERSIPARNAAVADRQSGYSLTR